MLAMFGGMALMLIPVILYFVFGQLLGAYLYLGLIAVILAIACALLYRYLITRGALLFDGLQN